MHYLKSITVLTLMASIGACSMFHNNEEPTIYQSNVKNTSPLTMPANLSKEGQEDYYPIPKVESRPSNAKVSILPPGSSLTKREKK